MEGRAPGDDAEQGEVAHAFQVHRDRFPDLSDEEYRTEIVEPMVRLLLPLAVRALIESLPAELGEAVRLAVATG